MSWKSFFSHQKIWQNEVLKIHFGACKQCHMHFKKVLFQEMQSPPLLQTQLQVGWQLDMLILVC